jgi:hypothetical protein
MKNIEKLGKHPKEIVQVINDYPELIENLKKHTALQSIVNLACGWAGDTTMTLECFFSDQGMTKIEDKLDDAEIEAAKIVVAYMEENNISKLSADDVKKITHDYSKVIKQRVSKIKRAVD